MAGNTQSSAGHFFNIVDAGLPGLTRTNPELIGQIGEQWQTKFDANRDYYYTVNNALSNVQVNNYDTDKKIKQEVMQMVDDAVGTSVAKGEFLYLKNDLLKLADSIQKHEGLNRAISSKAARDAFIESVNKTEGWSEAEKQTHLQWVENNYDHSVRYDPETGKAAGGYNGVGLSKWVDMSQVWKEAVDIASKFKANSVTNSGYSGGGMAIQNIPMFYNSTTNTVETLTQDEVTNGIMAYINSKPEVIDFIRDKTRLELFEASIVRDADGRRVMLPDGKIQTKPLDEKWVAQRYLKPTTAEIGAVAQDDYLKLLESEEGKSQKQRQTLATEKKKILEKHGVKNRGEFELKFVPQAIDYMIKSISGSEPGTLSQEQIEQLAFFGKKADMLENTANALGAGLSFMKYSNTSKLTMNPAFSTLLKQLHDNSAQTENEGKTDASMVTTQRLGEIELNEESYQTRLKQEIKNRNELSNKLNSVKAQIAVAGDNVSQDLLNQRDKLEQDLKNAYLSENYLNQIINKEYENIPKTEKPSSSPGLFTFYTEMENGKPVIKIASYPDLKKDVVDEQTVVDMFKSILQDNILSDENGLINYSPEQINNPDFLKMAYQYYLKELEANGKFLKNRGLEITNPRSHFTAKGDTEKDLIEAEAKHFVAYALHKNATSFGAKQLQFYTKTLIADVYSEQNNKSNKLKSNPIIKPVDGVNFDANSKIHSQILTHYVNVLNSSTPGIIKNLDGSSVVGKGKDPFFSLEEEKVKNVINELKNAESVVEVADFSFIPNGNVLYNMPSNYIVSYVTMKSHTDNKGKYVMPTNSYVIGIPVEGLSEDLMNATKTNALVNFFQNKNPESSWSTYKFAESTQFLRTPAAMLNTSVDAAKSLAKTDGLNMGDVFDNLKNSENGSVRFRLYYGSSQIPVPVEVYKKTDGTYGIKAYEDEPGTERGDYETNLPVDAEYAERIKNMTFAQPVDAVFQALIWNSGYMMEATRMNNIDIVKSKIKTAK